MQNFENGVQPWSSGSVWWPLQLPYRNLRQKNYIDMVEKWPLKTVEINTALCRQVPGQKLPVQTNWTNLNLRFQTNHSKISISLVPRIFISLLRLNSWERPGEPGDAGVSTDQKKIFAERLWTRLCQDRPRPVVSVTKFCNFTLILAMQALFFCSYRQIRQCKHRIVHAMTW